MQGLQRLSATPEATGLRHAGRGRVRPEEIEQLEYVPLRGTSCDLGTLAAMSLRLASTFYRAGRESRKRTFPGILT